MKRFTEMLKDESGQGMVEYGLIIGLVAVIVVAVFLLLGGQIKSFFSGTVDTETVGKGQALLSEELYE